MPIDNRGEWLKEFTAFSNTPTEAVPPSVIEALKKRLFPNPWVVFGKVTAVHIVVGFLSLAICNQFGLNPFQTNQSLTDWFMRLGGHHVCMLLCGMFFMAATYLLANFFLTFEELEAVKRHEWLQTGVIGLASLAAFYFFGAEMVMAFVALWAAGAILGGLLSIEGCYRLRRGLIQT